MSSTTRDRASSIQQTTNKMKEPEDTTSEVLLIPPADMFAEDPSGPPVKLSIKARRDDHDMNPSGWSIIAFTPSASIRCVRAHQIKHLGLFIRSIIALCGHRVSQEYSHTAEEMKLYSEIERVIHKITQGEFKKF